MEKQALIIRHLIFTGPNRESAKLHFEKGLNVLYGASETGKSFALEAINYMLGAKELHDIPERVGYNKILLGIEIIPSRKKFTLIRSTDGGQFLVFDGLHEVDPEDEESSLTLTSKHNEKNTNNISTFLLEKINFNNNYIKSNNQGTTKSLSFRNLCHLCLVDEQNIQKQRSPIEGGQVTLRTTEYSIFKLLLTGIDDRAFISLPSEKNIQGNIVKIELFDELINELQKQFGEKIQEETELKDQLQRLEKTISKHQNSLNSTEEEYNKLIIKRNDLRNKFQNGSDRHLEIGELIARFTLLDQHYTSDLERLEGIREVGFLVGSLENSSCPLCGSLPENQHLNEKCDGNLSSVVTAVSVESEKISKLKNELNHTLSQLKAENKNFDELLPKIEKEIFIFDRKIQEVASSISEHGVCYSDLLNSRANILSSLKVLERIHELTLRKEILGKEQPIEIPVEKEPIKLSSSTLDDFAKKIEAILKTWNFPDSDRVFFDEKTRDLVISGKHRGARGKGMRSITHAAFSIGLLEFCKENELSHPGFLILDSPLLAYREPEDENDDLSETDVQENFYKYLSNWDDRQIIIIENVNPPDYVKEMETSTMFSKNIQQGRYGLFPTRTK